MRVPYEIDVSAAIKKLGIRIPVHFEAESLNQMENERTGEVVDNPWFALRVTEGLTYGGTDLSHLPHYALIKIDWDAIKVGLRIGDETAAPDIVIGHELIHVEQQQGCHSGAQADHMYSRSGTLLDGKHAYLANPYEADAFARQEDIAPYVKLTPKVGV